MNINMDDEVRGHRSRFYSEVKSSGHEWVLVIVAGVYLGTMASTFSIRFVDNAILRYELYELNKQFTAEQAKMKVRQQEQNKINAARLKQQQIENEKKRAGFRQAMETCNFWQHQYRKEQTLSNLYLRDQSCDFVNEFR